MDFHRSLNATSPVLTKPLPPLSPATLHAVVHIVMTLDLVMYGSTLLPSSNLSYVLNDTIDR